MSVFVSVVLAVLLGSEVGPSSPTSSLAARSAVADGISSSKQKSLAKKLRQYVRESNPKKRERLWGKIKRDARKATPAQFESAVRKSYPGATYRAGFQKGIEFESQGESWTYTVHMPASKPKKLLPLVVDVGHSTVKDVEGVMGTWMNITGAKDDVIYLRTDVLNKLFADGRGPEWSGFRRGASESNMNTVAAILLDAIADASRRFPVDPDRVIVHGISQTGFWAWYLGMVAPSRFAAVVPVASRTLHVRHYPENFRGVHVHILHGTADETCPFGDAVLMNDKLRAAKADVEFTRVEGGPHMGMTFGRWREVWPKVAKKERSDRYPKEIEATLVGTGRSVVHWVELVKTKEANFQIGQRSGRVAGKIDGQRIDLQVDGVEELVVWLSSDMVDLDEKVTVSVNGKKAFGGKPKRAERAAVDFARRRGDGGAVYSAVVPIRVTK